MNALNIQYALSCCNTVDPASEHGMWLRREIEKLKGGTREELMQWLEQLEQANLDKRER